MTVKDCLRAQYPIRCITQQEAEFPALLKEIPYPPKQLYVRGATLTQQDHLAIVGTRRASAIGTQIASELARDCSHAGLTIVSGLAFGIDAAAHAATLAAGGRAVAVLGGGLDDITPRANQKLGLAILQSGGTLVSEYPPGMAPNPGTFIARNRIISGLCRGIIAVEAPQRSGTLSTARFAVEQNREVFVVPGSIRDPRYSGSNQLIQSGATLVTCADDVLEALGLLPNEPHQKLLPFLDEPTRRIVELLQSTNTPLSVDVIAERTALGVSVVSQSLTTLTLEGVAKENAGAYYI